MSREKRRRGLRGVPKRSEPGTPSAEEGFKIPMVPLGILAGVFATAGLFAYLIWQSGQPVGVSASDRVETEPRPDLPGEFVDLPEIYGDTTAPHVTQRSDFVGDGNSPPAGGPMFGNARCSDDPESTPAFCGPAPSGIYRMPWEPETLNHNMEHSGVVVWYNTSHREFLDELEGDVERRLRNRDLMVMTPYDRMEPETIAITSWARIDKFPVSEYTEDRFNDFVDAHACRYDSEGFC